MAEQLSSHAHLQRLWSHSSLPSMPEYAGTPVSDVEGLSALEAIATDTLALVCNGNLSRAERRITDFERAWNSAQPRLPPLTVDEWFLIEDAAYAAIASLRATKPDAAKVKTGIMYLIAALLTPQPSKFLEARQ